MIDVRFLLVCIIVLLLIILIVGFVMYKSFCNKFDIIHRCSKPYKSETNSSKKRLHG